MTVTFVIGAAASGKSAYAESLCLGHDGPRVYLATMEPFGEEGARRIARHRALREGKGFSTLERTRDVGAAASGLPCGCTLLLEDVGNPIDGNALWLVLFQMHVNAVRDIVFPYLQFNMGFILVKTDDIPVLSAFM